MAAPKAGTFEDKMLEIQETPYDFAAIFGNANPVELEIGIGKGRFLMQEAAAHPERNYLGIEWTGRYCRMAAYRATRDGLANIRFLRDDAAHTVKMAVADDALARLHIYFPDPWPKERHKKRRMIQESFLDVMTKKLVDGAEFRMATDHEDYFAQMVRVCSAHPKFEVVEHLVGDEAREGVTNWEVKFREEGRTIHNLTCIHRKNA